MMVLLNKVEFPKYSSEIQTHIRPDLDHIINMYKKYGKNEPDRFLHINFEDLDICYAPSIIVASERKVLGLPSPRFGYRLILPGIGIIHFRRYADMRHALKDREWAESDQPSYMPAGCDRKFGERLCMESLP